MRIQETAEGEIQLQIAMRKLVPTQKADAPPIWLVGVAHLGSKAYHEILQKHLNDQDLVLFEGVGFIQTKLHDLRANEEQVIFQKGMAQDSIQKDMVESLGLVFNLELSTTTELISSTAICRLQSSWDIFNPTVETLFSAGTQQKIARQNNSWPHSQEHH